MPGNVVDFDEALSLTITSRKVGDLATNLFSKEQLGGRSGRQSLLIASQSPEQHAMISDLAIHFKPFSQILIPRQHEAKERNRIKHLDLDDRGIDLCNFQKRLSGLASYIAMTLLLGRHKSSCMQRSFSLMSKLVSSVDSGIDTL